MGGAGTGAGVIFCGDLNCPFQPKAVLRTRTKGRLQDAFGGLQLGVPGGKTHPAVTGTAEEDMNPPQILDFIFYDQATIRPRMATPIDRKYKGSQTEILSDHFPVWFLFEFLPTDLVISAPENHNFMRDDPYFEVFGHEKRRGASA